MKYIISFLIIFLYSCNSSKHQGEGKGDFQYMYKVYKIENIKNYHIIYAKRNDSLFKIVSEKLGDDGCKKIKKNKSYPLRLRSMLNNVDSNNKRIPANYLDITCFTFKDDVVICKEEGMNDLYYADNLKGLCIIDNNQ